MRALRGAAVVTVVLLAAPASAFVRSTTGGTPGSGLPLFWKNPIVAYSVNSGFFQSKPGCSSGAAAAALAKASFPAWTGATHPGQSQVCTSFQFVDGGDTTSKALGFNQAAGAKNENLVVFRSGLCAAQTGEPLCTTPPPDKNGQPDLGPCVQTTNCWEHDGQSGPGGTIALTTVTYDPATGEIFDADMELHDWNGSQSAPDGMYFTCAPPGAGTCVTPYSQAGCVYWDVGNTVTHEAGHMLGLDHVCVPGGPCPTVLAADGTTLTPVMAPNAAPGDTDKRTLKPDDIDGVCSIYPVKSTGGGGCGCGTASASGLALLGLFLAALRPRRGMNPRPTSARP